MTRHGAHPLWFAAAVTASVVLHGPGRALGCGFEDPSSASLQRGALNLSYPNALHVIGALTLARVEGGIAPRPEAPATKDLFGSELRKTVSLLQQFGDMLGARPTDLAFSMVLVEPMLWTRFGVRDGEVTISVHINGPPVGDPVLITTEATLREIVGHRLTSKRADETGLIRIYGDSAQAARLRAIFADGAVRILE